MVGLCRRTGVLSDLVDIIGSVAAAELLDGTVAAAAAVAGSDDEVDDVDVDDKVEGEAICFETAAAELGTRLKSLLSRLSLYGVVCPKAVGVLSPKHSDAESPLIELGVGGSIIKGSCFRDNGDEGTKGNNDLSSSMEYCCCCCCWSSTPCC